LGQHPNILPLEEGNWLDRFAFELGCLYESGSRRGERSQLAALGISGEEFYEKFGRAAHDLIISSRGRYLEHADSTARRDPAQAQPSFHLMRRECDPKARWVDGTPEYSFCIYGLLKLFPDARFIHIVRDVRSVVRSLVMFSADGAKVVQNECDAYKYWLNTARACVSAETAFGSDRIYRVRYADLASDPAGTVAALLDFLEEPFCEDCLEPLATRINSSRVPSGFDSRDGTTPDHLLDEAVKLSDQLQQARAPSPPVELEVNRIERQFWDRVHCIGTLEAELDKAIRNYFSIEKELAARTEWAMNLERRVSSRDETIRALQDECRREVAERDAIIRDYQSELKKRTIRNGLWQLGHNIFRRGSRRDKASAVLRNR
jgi:hypothetical protein